MLKSLKKIGLGLFSVALLSAPLSSFAAGNQCLAVFHEAPRLAKADLPKKATNEEIIDAIMRLFGVRKELAGPEITVDRVATSPMAQNLVRLAQERALLNQQDPRLGQLGLLVPNGGLCASTCAINLVGSMLPMAEGQTAKAFNEFSPKLLEAIVQNYSKTAREDILIQGIRGVNTNNANDIILAFVRALDPKQVDARYGAYNELIVDSLRPVIDLLGGQITKSIVPTTFNLEYMTNRDGLLLGTADLYDANGAVTTQHGRHAIIVVKYDSATNEIVISDPNEPNRIFAEKVTMTPAGEISFRMRLSYSGNGMPSTAVLRAVQYIEHVRPIAYPGAG